MVFLSPALLPPPAARRSFLDPEFGWTIVFSLQRPEAAEVFSSHRRAMAVSESRKPHREVRWLLLSSSGSRRCPSSAIAGGDLLARGLPQATRLQANASVMPDSQNPALARPDELAHPPKRSPLPGRSSHSWGDNCSGGKAGHPSTHHPSIPPQLHSQQCSIHLSQDRCPGTLPPVPPGVPHGRSLLSVWNRDPSMLPAALKSPPSPRPAT